MPYILKLKHLSNTDISESLFLGGTTLSDQTATSFSTQSGDITVQFTGTHLTYDAQGMITGGKIDEYRVYQGAIAIDTQIVIVNSSFTLLTGQMLARVFQMVASGDAAGANAVVMHNWIKEGIALNDYSLDDVHGTRGDDFLLSGVGPTTVTGLGGKDVIELGFNGGVGLGGEGNDALYANGGSATLYGGGDNDLLWGSHARHDQLGDLLSGGAGDDGITGRRGFDTLMGDDGNDQLSHGGVLFGGRGDDRLTGGHESADMEGDGGRDVLLAGGGNDTLDGGSSDDSLFGQGGNDVIHGGQGDDRIEGGAGQNTLFGGAGADVFVFAHLQATDVIFDYQLDTDRINLHAFHFADRDAVAALMQDTSEGVLLDLGNGQTVLIHNVLAADLRHDVIL